MKSSKLSLIIIVILALVVGVLSYSYLSGSKTTIYLFNDSYSAGEEIHDGLFTVSQIDTDLVYEAASRGDAQYITPNNIQEVTGDYLRSDVVAGTPFLSIHSDEVGGSAVEKRLSEDMVGITIEADNITGGTPFVVPDTFVNVYVNYELEDSQLTDLILQNVRVIDVLYAEVYNESSESPTLAGVTLEVSPEDSMPIQHAANFGEIKLGVVKGGSYEMQIIDSYFLDKAIISDVSDEIDE